MSIRIESDKLILRQFSPCDAKELHEICEEPYILKWMPDWKCSLEQRKELLAWFEKQYPLATKQTARVMLAVTLKPAGNIIGMVGIGNKKEVDNEIEIAYFISRKHSGKGYISQAAKMIVQWAFSSLEMDYIIAIVETDNYPSQRVVEKCGFRKIDIRMIQNCAETKEKPFFYYRLYNKNYSESVK